MAALGPGKGNFAANCGEPGAATVAKDEAKAARYYERAIAIDDSDANLHALHGYALIGADKPRQGADAFRRALKIDPGNPRYSSGLGIAVFKMKDYRAAVAAFEKVVAVRTDDGGTFALLGIARERLGNRRAADAGNAGGQAGLGHMYYRGLGGARRDHGRAAAWFRKAAHQGADGAMARLAYMYEHGEGVPRNSRTATKLYFKAARLGNAKARRRFRELDVAASNPVFRAPTIAATGPDELPPLTLPGAAPLPAPTVSPTQVRFTVTCCGESETVTSSLGSAADKTDPAPR